MNQLFTACQIVGKESHLHFKWVEPQGPILDHLKQICKESQIVYKQVRLDGRWWEKESLPMLGFTKEFQPVALVWNGKRYVADVDDLQPIAYTFYPSFPEHASIWDIVRLSLKGNISTLFQLLLLGSMGSLIGLFSPFIFKQLFDQVIPEADYSMLVQILLGLIAVAISGMTFQVVRSFILLRLEGLMQSKMNVALWDRLFKLPLHFFRLYATGDLIQRAGIVDRTRELIGGTLLQIFVSTLLSLFYLFPMFYFSWQLSLVGLTILGLSFIVSVLVLIYRNRFQRFFLELGARMNKFLLQLVNGIDKVRIAGAEERAFSYWNALFSKGQNVAYVYGKALNVIQIFTSVLSSLSLFFIYLTVFTLLETGESSMTIGTFMAFNAAFTPFSQAFSSVLGSLTALMALVPAWERGKVILEEMPEVTKDKKKPPRLAGEIKLQNVSFRYETEGSWTLQDISLDIPPGQFIGVVGPSGGGKSTLLRLLLGFEQPQKGEIFYDQNNLQNINTEELRKQLGVILQSSAIFAGTIYENILAGRKASVQQIGEAIQLSCFDEVLRELPMGLDTSLPTGGGTLSGGQKQRLLLARALLLNPPILFMDEATSALDGHVQEKISQNLAHLKSTRLVIAHRISTIQKADRIYVIERGRLVDQGNYQELIHNNTLFSNLVNLQKL